MAEKIPRNAYWMHDVLRVSEPITIGRHAWRLVHYRKMGRGGRVEPTLYVDYDWQDLDDGLQRWRQACSWPGYDVDAEHRGLPQELRKLYDACPWAHPPREDPEKPAGGDTSVNPMHTKSIGGKDTWYPGPQLTAPERAMLESAIALGLPPAPRRAERPGEGTEVVSVEPKARAGDDTVLSMVELWEEGGEGGGAAVPRILHGEGERFEKRASAGWP